jgi:hypothetical protein
MCAASTTAPEYPTDVAYPRTFFPCMAPLAIVNLPAGSARIGRGGGFEIFALSGDQTPGPFVTTVKLGRRSTGLMLCTTSNAATGRRRPSSSRFPRLSSLVAASTARGARGSLEWEKRGMAGGAAGAATSSFASVSARTDGLW